MIRAPHPDSFERRSRIPRDSALFAGRPLRVFLLIPGPNAEFSGCADPARGPTSITLTGQHPRIQTFGGTATVDLGTFLLRMEALYTPGRTFSYVSNAAFTQQISDQATAVVGIDYTQLEKWRVGLQVSEQYLLQNFNTPIFPRSLPLISLHADGTPWSNHTLDVTLSYVINDGSTLSELRYWIPATDQLEIGAGIDLWQGGLNKPVRPVSKRQPRVCFT